MIRQHVNDPPPPAPPHGVLRELLLKGLYPHRSPFSCYPATCQPRLNGAAVLFFPLPPCSSLLLPRPSALPAPLRLAPRLVPRRSPLLRHLAPKRFRWTGGSRNLRAWQPVVCVLIMTVPLGARELVSMKSLSASRVLGPKEQPDPIFPQKPQCIAAASSLPVNVTSLFSFAALLFLFKPAAGGFPCAPRAVQVRVCACAT